MKIALVSFVLYVSIWLWASADDKEVCQSGRFDKSVTSFSLDGWCIKDNYSMPVEKVLKDNLKYRT